MLVSVFDIDTVVVPGYFECLTYHYLTAEKPLRSSYQPVPVYTNNIWQAAMLSRMLSFSATFWQMIQQARPEILITYSSQAIGLKPLVEIGFWQENVISEDSRIFYQAFLHYHGDWQVVPLFFPVKMDANVSTTFWQTMKALYKQQRRWAYGVENTAYLLFGFLHDTKIAWQKKFRYGFNILEGFHSWTTHSIILLLLGWLPLWLGAEEFRFTILSYNLPRIVETFMRIAMLGILFSAYLSIFLMPPAPENKKSKLRSLPLILQWFLSPVVILLTTIPAIEAVTRLMLGRYMGFWVTPKSRDKQSAATK